MPTLPVIHRQHHESQISKRPRPNANSRDSPCIDKFRLPALVARHFTVDALLQSYADSGSFLQRPVRADDKTLTLDFFTEQAGTHPWADDQPDLPD